MKSSLYFGHILLSYPSTYFNCVMQNWRTLFSTLKSLYNKKKIFKYIKFLKELFSGVVILLRQVFKPIESTPRDFWMKIQMQWSVRFWTRAVIVKWQYIVAQRDQALLFLKLFKTLFKVSFAWLTTTVFFL